jgi:hypothetical protein
MGSAQYRLRGLDLCLVLPGFGVDEHAVAYRTASSRSRPPVDADMRTMKPTRSMVFEKDDLRRVNDWIPGDVVVHMLIAAHITILPMRKGTLKPRPRLDISGFRRPPTEREEVPRYTPARSE